MLLFSFITADINLCSHRPLEKQDSQLTTGECALILFKVTFHYQIGKRGGNMQVILKVQGEPDKSFLWLFDNTQS